MYVQSLGTQPRYSGAKDAKIQKKCQFGRFLETTRQGTTTWQALKGGVVPKTRCPTGFGNLSLMPMEWLPGTGQIQMKQALKSNRSAPTSISPAPPQSPPPLPPPPLAPQLPHNVMPPNSQPRSAGDRFHSHPGFFLTAEHPGGGGLQGRTPRRGGGFRAPPNISYFIRDVWLFSIDKIFALYGFFV